MIFQDNILQFDHTIIFLKLILFSSNTPNQVVYGIIRKFILNNNFCQIKGHEGWKLTNICLNKNLKNRFMCQ
ncbi:hypothetical protein pb186bvf_020530 [Paramecium bursaria]